jgi:Putative neutral zinc metallopeptidase
VLFGANPLAWAGVVLFGAQTLFTLITLPVEFDASARAQQLLVSQGIIRGEQQVESSLGSFLYVAYIVYSMIRRNERLCRPRLDVGVESLAATRVAPAVEQIKASEPGTFVNYHRARIDPIKAQNTDAMIRFEFTDASNKPVALHVRRGDRGIHRGSRSVFPQAGFYDCFDARDLGEALLE